ncbi:hypothetical protein DEU56DRAFT_915618 [Suillus clintonianus]|uniref:uncharacterized protein n=1 Tax=Suillus clintonianus TaxID=1904413 RepID=UPI001B879325|nr:uncharacterized protein DEU56DRAFT_915618 [Suillus clintonianus]KAG2128014.1 hypothetical protein DEU56DRAFT_915618 [Suillus clintonianus]
MANTLSPSDLKCYAKEMRKLSTQRVRKPWRRSSRPRVKHSAAEKSAARKQRKEFRTEYSAALAAARDIIWEQAIQLREKFGHHSVDYYETIMQQSRKTVNKCPATRWNVFVRQEVKRANDALPPGTEHQKAPAMMKDLSEHWKDMSKDEREAITEDTVGDLNNHREMKELFQRNITVSLFQDVKRTLASIDRELAALNARTGMEIIVLAVRSDVDHFNQPHVFHTKRARDFFTACLKSSVHDIAFRLEGFCVVGVKGLARTHIEEFIIMLPVCGGLIFYLETVAALQKVSRMYYQNFDTNITAQYRIIIENWPLAKFCAPGDISSRNELSVLYRAWESDATRFHHLTDTEFELWKEDRFQAALALQNDTTVEGTQNEAAMEGTQNEAAVGGTQPSESSPKHPLESSPVTTDTAHPNNTDPQTQPQPDANPRPDANPCPSGSSQPRGHKCKAPSAEVLNTVFSSNGDGVPVQKKAQKERSDKGKAGGSWKKVPADAPQESEVPPASAE